MDRVFHAPIDPALKESPCGICPAHSPAPHRHHPLAGHPQPGAFFDKVASRDDWPSYSSTLDHLRPRSDGVPTGVNLPTFLMEGPLTWPGQHAGFLGPRHDPWQITRDPSQAG